MNSSRPPESKMLAGWRVLVPRGGKWGDAAAVALRAFGATAVIAPMINFASTEQPEQLADALRRLGSGTFDWVVITSATTVDVMTSQQAVVPDTTRIAVIGETTAPALAMAGYRTPDFVPEGDNSVRGLLKEWAATGDRGRVLVLQSDVAEPALVSGLAGLDTEFVSAYRTVGVPVSPQVAEDVSSGRIQAILIPSGSVARQVRDQLAPLPAETIVACIGPRTAFDARAAGLTVHLIAESRSIPSLAEAVAEHARAHPLSGEG